MSLRVEHLSKDYPTRSGPLPVLRDLNLALDRGEALAVMGPSGSGKSTLLHILGTLDRPTSGRIDLDGKDPFALSEPELADFRNRHIGFVFQDHYLLPQCSVLENVLIPTLVSREDRGQAEAWARQLLERVGLGPRLKHKPSELSGGEMQRAAIARALVNRPRVLLADEPTGNLDADTGAEIVRLLRDLNHQEGLTIVMVTHNLDLVAETDRVVRLVSGRVEEAQPLPAVHAGAD